MNKNEEKNQVVEVAKQQARKQIRRKTKAITKKAGKVVARAALNAATALIKTLISFLSAIGLPYAFIIGGVLFLLFMIYFATTMLFSSGADLSPEANKLRDYIIEQADKTVDMSREEQIPYRVPHELIISALQIYDSTKHGKTQEEAIKIMAKALAPIFTYEDYEGFYETESTTCVDGSCTTTTSKEPFTINALIHVEAWDRVYTATYEPYITDWVISKNIGSTTITVPKQSADGETIPGEFVDIDSKRFF